MQQVCRSLRCVPVRFGHVLSVMISENILTFVRGGCILIGLKEMKYALIAQLDRASACGAKGWGFDFLWGHKKQHRKPVLFFYPDNCSCFLRIKEQPTKICFSFFYTDHHLSIEATIKNSFHICDCIVKGKLKRRDQ